MQQWSIRENPGAGEQAPTPSYAVTHYRPQDADTAWPRATEPVCSLPAWNQERPLQESGEQQIAAPGVTGKATAAHHSAGSRQAAQPPGRRRPGGAAPGG